MFWGVAKFTCQSVTMMLSGGAVKSLLSKWFGGGKATEGAPFSPPPSPPVESTQQTQTHSQVIKQYPIYERLYG